MNTELELLEQAFEKVLAEMKAEAATMKALQYPTRESLANAKAAIEAAEKTLGRSSPR